MANARFSSSPDPGAPETPRPPATDGHDPSAVPPSPATKAAEPPRVDRFAEDQASFNRWLNGRLAQLHRIYVADALPADFLELVRSRREETGERKADGEA
jgi:hypothetical protein